MIIISGTGLRPAYRAAKKRAVSAFEIAAKRVNDECSTPVAGSVHGLLGIQETIAPDLVVGNAPPDEGLVDDRAALHYGHSMLALLDAMQLSLLGGTGPTLSPGLFSQETGSKADPGLANVITAIRVRVAVEDARASKE